MRVARFTFGRMRAVLLAFVAVGCAAHREAPPADGGVRLGYDLGLARACGADRYRVAEARARSELLIGGRAGDTQRLVGFEQALMDGRVAGAPSPAACTEALARLDSTLTPRDGEAAPAAPLDVLTLAPPGGVPLRLIYASAGAAPADWTVRAYAMLGTWELGHGSAAPMFRPRFLEARRPASRRSILFEVASIVQIGTPTRPLTLDVRTVLADLAAAARPGQPLHSAHSVAGPGRD